jgi:hypothetical protein
MVAIPKDLLKKQPILSLLLRCLFYSGVFVSLILSAHLRNSQQPFNYYREIEATDSIKDVLEAQKRYTFGKSVLGNLNDLSTAIPSSYTVRELSLMTPLESLGTIPSHSPDYQQKIYIAQPLKGFQRRPIVMGMVVYTKNSQFFSAICQQIYPNSQIIIYLPVFTDNRTISCPEGFKLEN